MDAVDLPMTDFPPRHPAAVRVRDMLGGGKMMSILRTGEEPAGSCYKNVFERTNAKGGSMVLGWMITWLPEVYIEMMHHAVWKTPQGPLFDLTRPISPLGTTITGTTSFVVDEKIPTEPLTENRHIVLVDDPDVQGCLEAYRVNNRAARERALPVTKARLGGTGVVADFQHIDSVLNQSYADLHRLNGIIKARYCKSWFPEEKPSDRTAE